MSRSEHQRITIEGYTPQEMLAVSNEELDAFVFVEEPIVFQAGSAEILGQFRVSENTLTLELAQIDGGGEGVLPTIAVLAQRYAQREGLTRIEWRVHAIHCRKPNLKLRRLLERRGFEIRDFPGSGECYYKVTDVEP